MEEKYYLCVEYRKEQYGKCYFSIDSNSNLNYDTLRFYSLEELDELLKMISTEQILMKLKEDNVLYSLANEEDFANAHVSIRYQENGKERSIDVLSQECLLFPMEDFLKKDWNEEDKKLIYNNLGGYLDNAKTSAKMKNWIRSIRENSNDEILINYQALPYLDQRKIRQVVYGIQYLNMEKKDKVQLSRKKIQSQNKAA